MTKEKIIEKLDTFTRAYIECALWSSTDQSDESGGDPLDDNYSIHDISAKSLKEMVDDCRRFQENNALDLELSTLDEAQQGHDFWLTRNRHGAGFWDRKHISPEADKALDRLTGASQNEGECVLAVGRKKVVIM